ncbi:MAG: Endonuclease V [Candidatus Bathyarchaeota archaeon BA2]|nr:MAG: Endonuclease V [Candidatus Bathyarchaeota archaeon BA2]
MGFEEKLPIRLSPRFSVEKAHAIQLRLSKQVVHEDTLPETINYVAGVDVAYAKGLSIGAVAVLDFASLSLKDSQVVCLKTRFPYIPTLLSFREIPPAYSAIKKLRTMPDIFLVDGQGFAHPYRLGFATHLGLAIDRPTIGVAKSLLCGKVGPVGEYGWSPVMDGGEIVGAEVVTKPGTRPIYVSVGHRVSLKRAIDIVRSCTRTYRTPEPIRRAHMLANEEKRKLR